MKTFLLFAVSQLVFTASAVRPPLTRPGNLLPPLEDTDVSALRLAAEPVSTTGDGYFEQLLDHKNPSKGTFKQKFWWNTQYYGGPGSPVIFFTPGETAAAAYGAYLTNATITGTYAQEVKGAVVMVEHRYYGESSPFPILNAETLQMLTLDNAIADFVRFAKIVDLPFDKNHSSNAGNAPWVYVGGSYSGSLAAWTESVSPGTFWAYHASSAPVEAIKDYWQYFVPVQQGMPKNCSTDINRVVEHMDKVFLKGTKEEQHTLKKQFGLESLEHGDDVMAMLEWGPWLWQSNSYTTGYSGFYKFCDMIENVQPGAVTTPNAYGVGLQKALAGYAKWMKEVQIPGYCQGYGYQDLMETACMNTYNATNLIFTDESVYNNVYRQWLWSLYQEPFGWWQDGAPRSRETLVSRLIKPDYWLRQGELNFPTVNGYTYAPKLNPDLNEHRVNKHTKGWRLVNTTRLIYVNGEFDPWRTASVSSEFRPGGPLASTKKVPVEILPGGFHCSDLRRRNWDANAGVQQVMDRVIKQVADWVGEFYEKA